MEHQSKVDPTRQTAGAIYRDAVMNGERGVVIGDVNHEIKKDLVKDINEAIEIASNHSDFKGKPFYLAMYEKYDLMLKRGLVRLPKVTKYRPYPEQDTMVFHVYPEGTVYFCWELPHRSHMINIMMNPDFYPQAQVDMIRKWENMQLEHFGFKKDAEGNWIENQHYRGDTLLSAPQNEQKTTILHA